MQSLTEVLSTSAIGIAYIALPLREASTTNRSHYVQHSKLIAADHMMFPGVASGPGGVAQDRDGCRSTASIEYSTEVYVWFKKGVRDD